MIDQPIVVVRKQCASESTPEVSSWGASVVSEESVARRMRDAQTRDARTRALPSRCTHGRGTIVRQELRFQCGCGRCVGQWPIPKLATSADGLDASVRPSSHGTLRVRRRRIVAAQKK